MKNEDMAFTRDLNKLVHADPNISLSGNFLMRAEGNCFNTCLKVNLKSIFEHHYVYSRDYNS